MTLQLLFERGVLSAIDVTFAHAMARLSGENSPHVRLAAALASRAVQRGHVCVDLNAIAERPLVDDDGQPIDTPLPTLSHWLADLERSALVSDGSRPAPLVLCPPRLYLYRYFDYEQRLASALTERAGRARTIDGARLAAGLRRLFPQARPGDEQQRAAAIAVLRSLSLISGGPGTGKTTTVAKILALLQEQAFGAGEGPLRIALVAPTGKAAQRLGEAISSSLAALDVAEAVRAAIPHEAATIHRTLGHRPRTPTRFRHGHHRPLDVDVVLADEASMIDLSLMTKLVEAVPPQARLILLGDKDQLASVEAGAILGDIHAPDPARSAGLAASLAALDLEPGPVANVPAIADCTSQLTKSHRYRGKSGIGALARAVNAGDEDGALEVLRGDATMPYGEVALVAVDPAAPMRSDLGRAVLDGYRTCLVAGPEHDRLAALGQFRVLCAHRRGPLGVESLNLTIAAHLRREGLVSGEGEHYDGRPVLITRNDYTMGLFNGDVGLVVRRGDALVALFPGTQASAEELRRIPVGRLPPHETVFAMTVHKSQGSEFDRVAVVLPPRSSPVLTRELIYTAITRARSRVDVFGRQEVFADAVRQRVERASGLRQTLWGAPRHLTSTHLSPPSPPYTGG